MQRRVVSCIALLRFRCVYFCLDLIFIFCTPTPGQFKRLSESDLFPPNGGVAAEALTHCSLLADPSQQSRKREEGRDAATTLVSLLVTAMHHSPPPSSPTHWLLAPGETGAPLFLCFPSIRTAGTDAGREVREHGSPWKRRLCRLTLRRPDRGAKMTPSNTPAPNRPSPRLSVNETWGDAHVHALAHGKTKQTNKQTNVRSSVT